MQETNEDTYDPSTLLSTALGCSGVPGEPSRHILGPHGVASENPAGRTRGHLSYRTRCRGPRRRARLSCSRHKALSVPTPCPSDPSPSEVATSWRFATSSLDTPQHPEIPRTQLVRLILPDYSMAPNRSRSAKLQRNRAQRRSSASLKRPASQMPGRHPPLHRARKSRHLVSPTGYSSFAVAARQAAVRGLLARHLQ